MGCGVVVVVVWGWGGGWGACAGEAASSLADFKVYPGITKLCTSRAGGICCRQNAYSLGRALLGMVGPRSADLRLLAAAASAAAAEHQRSTTGGRRGSGAAEGGGVRGLQGAADRRLERPHQGHPKVDAVLWAAGFRVPALGHDKAGVSCNKVLDGSVQAVRLAWRWQRCLGQCLPLPCCAF